MRKWFRRIVKTCVFLFLLTVGGSLAAWILATRTPAFYADLRQQPSQTVEEKQRLHDSLQEMQTWVSLSHTGSAGKTFELTLTEEQLNESLRENNAGNMREPRALIGDDTLQIGVEAGLQERTYVLSCELRPSIGENGRLQFDVESGYVGNLPLPLSLLSKALKRTVRKGKTATLDLSGSTPRIYVDLHRLEPRKVRLTEIQCADGVLKLGFERVVGSEVARRSGTPQ